ncbi:MAG: Smr/MutS family protein [Chitinophagales bacterium]
MKKEKFSIGEKVFLIHLKEEALISRIVNDDLIYVDAGGMEIPVFTSDVTRLIPVKQPVSQEPETIAAPEKKNLQAEQITGTNSGIFLSFEPVKEKSGDTSTFNIYFINDTGFPVEFIYIFSVHGQLNFRLKKLMVPYNYLLLHVIEYDLLNEIPSVQLDVRDVMNKNFTGKLEQKIKAQNFFNKLSATPILQTENYNYKVITESLQVKKEPVQKSVSFDAEVLKQMMMEVPVVKDQEVGPAVMEIDLHIERLARDHEQMGASEMLRLQLTLFQRELERAIAHRAERLFAIHGIGTGKLKNEIHRLLKSYKEVRSFNNEYHSRYGYGATEIILR